MLGKKKKKVYIPVDKYPEINFMGLLIGPRGSNQKRMEDESGAKILIRGKGSSKDCLGDPDENDALHVLITADTDEAIAKAEHAINAILFNPEQAMRLKQEQLRKVAELKFSNGESNEESGHYGPGEGSMSCEMPVPRAYVGYIIGRGGETIRDLQARSGAHIQIVREEEGAAFTPERFVSIAGSDESVESAKKLIDQLLKDRTNNSLDDSRYGGTNPDGSESIEILIPNDRVGLVIGRGGTTIRSIQVRTGTNVTVPQAPDASNPAMRKITIRGTIEAKEAAKAEILGLIGENQGATPANASVLYMQVPNDRVGVVIGKRGDTIKGIQERHAVRVQIPQAPDPGSNPPIRTISIHGPQEALQLAKEEIDLVIVQGAGAQGMGGYGHYDSYYNSMGGGAGYEQYGSEQTFGNGYTQAQYEAYCQQYYQQTPVVDASAGAAAPGEANYQASAVSADPNAYWNGFYEYAAYYGIDAANAAWGVTGAAAQETAETYRQYQLQQAASAGSETAAAVGKETVAEEDAGKDTEGSS